MLACLLHCMISLLDTEFEHKFKRVSRHDTISRSILPWMRYFLFLVKTRTVFEWYAVHQGIHTLILQRSVKHHCMQCTDAEFAFLKCFLVFISFGAIFCFLLVRLLVLGSWVTLGLWLLGGFLACSSCGFWFFSILGFRGFLPFVDFGFCGFLDSLASVWFFSILCYWRFVASWTFLRKILYICSQEFKWQLIVLRLCSGLWYQQ